MATETNPKASRKGIPNHPLDFKRKLAAAACEPGVSVAKLAREYGINANLLFKWRIHYRAGHYDAGEVALLPVRVEAPCPTSAGPVEAVAEVSARTDATAPPLMTPPPEGEIEIQISTAIVRVRGDVNPATLRLVVDTLARYR